jgi:hypothetical protein
MKTAVKKALLSVVDPQTNLIIWLCVYVSGSSNKVLVSHQDLGPKHRIGTVQGCGNDGRSIWHENG